VQSYAGLLEFGLTACRRVVSQDESYEIVAHLQAALREIEALPTIHADAGVESAALESAAQPVIEPDAVIEPNKVSTKKTAGARPKAPG
jgi:IS5 family transposase